MWLAETINYIEEANPPPASLLTVDSASLTPTFMTCWPDHRVPSKRMASPLTNTVTRISPQNEYKNFLQITASRLSKFKPLDTFLHSKTKVPARITAIKFCNGSVPSKESDMNELELENPLKHRNDPNDRQLYRRKYNTKCSCLAWALLQS